MADLRVEPDTRRFATNGCSSRAVGATQNSMAVSRPSLRMSDDWIAAVKADLGRALLACVSYRDVCLHGVHVESKTTEALARASDMRVHVDRPMLF